MPNRIRQYRLFHTRLTPTEAELWASLEPEQLTSTTQVQGRLTGPRCHYASTVEVAYRWREHSRQYEAEGRPALQLRALIPEPSLWDPQSPFLYRVSLELWQGRQQPDRAEFFYGLRDFRLTPGGLRWNGRPWPLLGVHRDQLVNADAMALRGLGCNLVLTSAGNAAEICHQADRLGFLVLCRIHDLRGWDGIGQLAEHPSLLGCMLEQPLLDHPLVRDAGCVPLDAERMLIGIELVKPVARPLPAAFHFVAGTEQVLAQLKQVDVPKLIRRNQALAVAKVSIGDPPPGALGWLTD